jgi:drug/metabolite transporter (DMT)-like permease
VQPAQAASTALGHRPRPLILYGWIALAAASVSAAAIFIRLADTEPLTVASYRLAIAAVLVAAPTLLRARGELRALARSEVVILVFSGLFLAAHFAVWITSLSYTSVASSVLLVTTTPVFVAVASHFLLRERLGALTAWAVALSLAGGVVLALGGWDGDTRHLLGDGLALSGAVFVGGYMLLGRRIRGRVGVLPYVTVVYATGGAVLLVAAIASGASMLGLPIETYFWIGMSALLPQAIGHSLLNWSLAHVSATNVSLALRVEPIIATLLAIPVLGEVPVWTVAPGGILVMAGVYLAIRSESRHDVEDDPPTRGPQC